MYVQLQYLAMQPNSLRASLSDLAPTPYGVLESTLKIADEYQTIECFAVVLHKLYYVLPQCDLNYVTLEREFSESNPKALGPKDGMVKPVVE